MAGTTAVFSLAFVLLVISFAIGNDVSIRVIGVGVCLAFIAAIYQLARSAQFQLAAWLLLLVYLGMASVVSYTWGVTMPVAVMLDGLLIVLAGILLGARYSLYAALGVGVVVLSLETLQYDGIAKANLTWAQKPLDFGMVTGFCIIFGVIGLVTWLFNVRMEQSLHRAHRAEAGLLRQKLLLETKVEERTRELQAAQFDKLQQLYRFAELGQLSTALLHDLANHLTTLTLDIEGLEEQNRSRMLKRAKRSIRYIDDMVLRVRDQLQGKQSVKQFNVAGEIEEVVRILSHKAREAGVSLHWEAPEDRKELRCRGEPIRFRQLIANLVSNGIDAYPPAEDNNALREVSIRAKLKGSYVVITVTDMGRGIDTEDRDKLFTPFYSTKKTGMGLGLFISRQIVEDYFAGTITLDPSSKQTTFIVSLAKA